MARQGVGTKRHVKARPGVKSRIEMPLREGKQEFDVLSRKGEQWSRRTAARKPGGGQTREWGRGAATVWGRGVATERARRDPNEGALATWDPGGKYLRKHVFEAKGPVEANESEHARQQSKPGRPKNQSGSTIMRKW